MHSIASPVDLLSSTLRTGLMVSLPILFVVLVVGLLVNIVQVATQIQDASVSFVPKLVVAGIALMLLAPWMLRRLAMFATDVISSIPLIG
ncbi:flagellar biosynthetic protein FliQ [Niveibacterium sp. COAC-50]|uniref:flagellar biosynthetic protein FliQ n=1 Tax=Niveibacterium sp. COAC-50 TaxID=2729384 RepID=UPI001C12E50D